MALHLSTQILTLGGQEGVGSTLEALGVGALRLLLAGALNTAAGYVH